MPSGAEEGRAGVRILVLRPVDSGSDAWDAGARSESHTRVSLLCGALGVGAGVRTELRVLVGVLPPPQTWTYSENGFAWARCASRLRPLLTRGTGAGGDPACV